MAQRGGDLLSRLADAGEEAIQKLADAPGADRLLHFANSTRDRMDELQKRLRGVEALEARVSELERRLDQLSGGKRTAAAAKPPAKPAARKPAARSTAARGTSAAARAKKSPARRTRGGGTKPSGGSAST